MGLAALLCACAAPPARPPAPVEVAPVAPSAPAVPETPAPTEPATPAQPVATPREHIALILPLSSPAFASVADSVRQGFVAASMAEAKGAPQLRVYSAENEGDSLIANIRNAVNNGAVLVVGGLTRDGATALARHSLRQSELPMLALNTPDASTSNRFHFLSLALDNEARQVAQLASREGAKLATVVHGSGALAQRIQDAFEKEWQRLGGQIVLRIPVTGDINEAQAIRPKLENLRNDMVFIATDIASARTVRPYLPIWMTAYSTSLSVDARAEAVANVDMDGVRFLDMPWFVQLDHPAVMVYPRLPAETPIEQARLYALGIDGWRLALLLLGDTQRATSVDGVTGKLKLDGNPQVSRTLTPTEFRDGRATPYAKVE